MILVTGGTGFVGRALVKELLKRKNKIRCLVRGKKIEGVDNWVGDLRDTKSLKGMGKDVDVVVHLAAIGNVNAVSRKDSEIYKKTNVQGLRNLLRECKKVKKVILLSSLIVEKPYHSAYGETKRLAEEVLASSGLPYVIFRAPMIYDWEEPIGDFGKIVEAVKKGHIFVLDSGRYKMDLVSRKMVVREILKEVRLKSQKKAVKKLVEKSLGFVEFVEEVAKRYGVRKVRYVQLPFILISPLLFLIDVLSRVFGFIPPISFGRAKYLHRQDKDGCAGRDLNPGRHRGRVVSYQTRLPAHEKEEERPIF